MDFPDVYICFEQWGREKPQVRGMKTSEEEAIAFCKNSDYIPKSVAWFYRLYKIINTEDGKVKE